MKKRLLLIPLISAFALSGCDFMDTVKGWFSPKTEDKSSGDGKKDKGGDDDIPELIVDHTPQIKETYGGYKLARTIQEDKTYILGAYRHKDDKMRFFNGKYHEDQKMVDGQLKTIEYPYYLGTDEESVETAAHLEIEFLPGSTTEFAIHITTPDDTSKVYHDSYLGIYTGISNQGNVVTSLAKLNLPGDESYTDTTKDPAETFTKDGDNLSSTFTFCKKYTPAGSTEVEMYAPCMLFQKKVNGELKEDTAHQVFLGTTISNQNFISFDTESEEIACDGAAYDLAHFYEKIEA